MNCNFLQKSNESETTKTYRLIIAVDGLFLNWKFKLKMQIFVYLVNNNQKNYVRVYTLCIISFYIL